MSVTESTKRADIWKAIFAVVNTNKPTGWSVGGSFPATSRDNKLVLPYIALDSTPTSLTFNTITTDARSYEVSMSMNFYVSANDKATKDLDEAVDTIETAILTGASSLQDDNNLYYEDYSDGDTQSFFLSNNKVYWKEVTFRFMYIP